MEDQKLALQISPLANWTGNDASGLIGQHHSNGPYMFAPEPNNFHQIPVHNQMIQCKHCQQTPQNYVQYLDENGGYPEIMNQMPCNFPVHVPTLGLLSSSQEQYVIPHSQGSPLINYSNMEHQVSFQKEYWNGAGSNEFHTYNGSNVTAPPLKDSRKRSRESREKAYNAYRNRRLRISQSLDALQELLPHLKETQTCFARKDIFLKKVAQVSNEDFLDNVIDHMKYLQYQVKDLCRSRLGGESTTNSFISVEGHGHYLVNELRLGKPLEESFGKLLEVNPSAATELMQRRGLVVLPAAFVEALCEQTEIMDMQGKNRNSSH